MTILLFLAIGSTIGGGTSFAGRLRRPGHWSTDVIVGAACALLGGFAFRALAAQWVASVRTLGLDAPSFYSLLAAAVVASLALAIRELTLPHRFGGRFALRRIRPGLRSGPYVGEDVHPLRAALARVRSRGRRR